MIETLFSNFQPYRTSTIQFKFCFVFGKYYLMFSQDEKYRYINIDMELSKCSLQ